MERGRKWETERLREGEIREGGKESEGEGWREGWMEGRREREAETRESEEKGGLRALATRYHVACFPHSVVMTLRNTQEHLSIFRGACTCVCVCVCVRKCYLRIPIVL
jgi:hypothetical protein